MQCLFCKKTIPLLRRLKDSEFCSEDHRKQYVREQSLLALESLVSGDVRSVSRSRGKTLAEAGVGTATAGTGRGRTGILSNRRNSAGDPDLGEYEAQPGSAYSAALEAAHHMASGNDGQAHIFNDEECPTDDLLFDALSNITTDFEPKPPRADELSGIHSTQLHGVVEQTSAAGNRGVLVPIAALESSHWNFPASIPRRRVALILRRKRAELAKLFVSARTGEKGHTSTNRAAVPLSWPGSSGPTISRLALAIEGELTPPPPVFPPIAAALDISFEHVIHGGSMDPAGQPAFEQLSPTRSLARLDLNLAQNPGLALTGAFEGNFIELRSHSGKAGAVPSDWFSPIVEPEIRPNVPHLSLPCRFLAEFAIGEASEGSVVNPRSVAGFLGSAGGIEPHAASVQPAMNRLTLPAALRTGFALQKAHEGAVIARPNRPALSGAARFEQEPFSIAQAIRPLQLSSNPLTLFHSERVHMEFQLTQKDPESIPFAAAAGIAWTKSEPRLARVRLKIEGSVEVPPPPMTLSLKDAVKLRAVNVVELAASGVLYLNPSPLFCASTSTADSFAAPAILAEAFSSSLLAKCAITGLAVDPCPWPRIDALHGETRLDPKFPIAVLPSVETGKCHGLIPSAAINLRSSELSQVSLDFVPFTIVPALAASVTLSDSAVTWQLEGQADAPRTLVEPTAPPMAPASPLHFTRKPHKSEFQLAAFDPHCALGAIEVALLPQGISTLYNTGLTPPQSGPVGAPAPPAASVPPISPSELANFIENLRQASIIPAMLASERHEEPVRSWKDALAEAEQAAPSLYPVEIPAVLAAAAAAGGAVSWRPSSPISTNHSLPVTDTITVLERTPVTKAPDTRRLEVASRPTGHGRRLRNSEATPPPPAAAPPAEDVLGQIPAPPILEPALVETAIVEQAIVETAKIETPKIEQAKRVAALENIAENALPPMAGLAPLTLNKMKKSKAKINQSLGPLQVLIQAAQIPSGLTASLYEPAARTESVLRQKVQDSKPSGGFFLFWRKAPADLKWITLSLPVVLVVWMMTSGRNHPKPANPIPAPLESSASVGAGETETAALPVKGQKAAAETKEALVKGTVAPAPPAPSPEKVEEGSWSKFMQRVTYRSAIAHEEDFRSGLSQWEGRGAWTSTWNYDRNGLLRPGQLALFSPSLEMTDYHLEVTGSLDRRSFGWVFRATDMNNYYGGRLVETRPGPMPTVTLERFIVAGGKKIKSQFFPVPLPMRGESIFTVAVEVAGNSFTTSVQGQIVDSFNDDRLTSGGVGLFALKGEESRIFRISLTHNNDLFGRLCAMIAPRETISPGGRAK